MYHNVEQSVITTNVIPPFYREVDSHSDRYQIQYNAAVSLSNVICRLIYYESMLLITYWFLSMRTPYPTSPSILVGLVYTLYYLLINNILLLIRGLDVMIFL